MFPRPDGSPWTRDDWANWRHRTFQANAEKIGRLNTRPYDLRHSFVSLLIAEGRTVIDVAGQAGHSPETCLRYYAHLFAEFDPGCGSAPRTRSARPAVTQVDAQRTQVAVKRKRRDAGFRATLPKPTPGLEPGTPSLRVKCSTS